METTRSRFLIGIGRRSLFVASIAASVITGLALLWQIDIYSDAFPNSYNIHIAFPSIHQSWNNDGGHWTGCKDVGWSLTASLSAGKPESLRQYYTRKWDRESVPGGMRVSSSRFAYWDSFSLFEWYGRYRRLTAYKQVNYPDAGDQPFRYSVATIVSFCSTMN